MRLHGGVRGRLGFALVLFFLLAPGPVRADELATTRQRLAEIERRIETAAATAAEKRDREERLAADLATLEEEQGRLEQRIRERQVSLRQLSARIGTEERLAAEIKRSVTVLAGKVRQRLVGLYKSGDGGLLRVLFGATSPAGLAEDYDFLGRIIRRDRQLITSYRDKLQQQEEGLQRLAQLKRQEEASLAASRREQQTLKAAGALKARLVAELRQERADLERELADLRERAERLVALVKRLESTKGAEYSDESRLFAQQQGRLAWPLQGPVEVTFGTGRNPQLGTLHDSQGIEIGCRAGEEVRAIWAGRVIFANWFKGYGRLLIIDHGDSYYSLYAQAASLTKQVGEQVERGEVVALTGYEGARRLYFEIRHSGTPLDPEAWLAPHQNH